MRRSLKVLQYVWVFLILTYFPLGEQGSWPTGYVPHFLNYHQTFWCVLLGGSVPWFPTVHKQKANCLLLKLSGLRTMHSHRTDAQLKAGQSSSVLQPAETSVVRCREHLLLSQHSSHREKLPLPTVLQQISLLHMDFPTKPSHVPFIWY